MKVNKYNGWTNWDTWNAYTILANNERSCNNMIEAAKSSKNFIQEVVMALAMETINFSDEIDLLPDAREINYFELKRTFLES